jgi:hypothetical protein
MRQVSVMLQLRVTAAERVKLRVMQTSRVEVGVSL